ncbi:MAG TPA: helix-turn-helix domain-containing protein [Vicinamibacterales bacterium]|jgi:predicted ATPase/DNA-binding XRE family transcriptional regulator|nr:helix-turn-helix domain-containing protein [Vicinamibacterales bacterium]
MKSGAPGSFGAQLKALREAAGFTQEELATVAGLSVHAVSALERGERRRPHGDTVRALSAALDLTEASRDALLASGRAAPHTAVVDELSDGSLPLALTALLGRDEDLKTLRAWLADRAVRLVTLTGPGGAGKTRLAQEVARRIAVEGAARAVFVPLAAIRDPAFVAAEIAEALGLLDISALNLSKHVRAWCDGRPTLLVLDNFEQILDAAPLVAELLSSVAALSVLVTSRAPLRVRGEREYGVGPLPLTLEADDLSPADLARSPAVRLFVERVRDAQPDFRLTSANGATVASICRRLDALPLALELAAPWLKVLTPEDLLRRLAQNVLFSAIGPRDLPERQQTMNATVAWSYQLLAPTEQRVFRRLGVLSGDFPIEAAAAVVSGQEGAVTVSDEALAATAGLVDKSLLLRAPISVPTRPLYRMLETVRAYAALELGAASERDDAMEGLVRYCIAEASLAAEGLVGPAQGEWLDRVRDDLENYRCALTWLLERGRSAEASAIIYRLFFFWVIRGHANEGLEWYERMLALPSLPPAVESAALVGAGVMRYTQAEFEKSRAAATRALALASSSINRDWVPVAELLLGHLEHISGNEEAALHCYDRSLRESGSNPTPWRVGNALTGMARVALATGDFDQAERLLREADERLRGSGPWFMLLPLYLRATLAARRGNSGEAIALVRDSLVQIRELHDKFAFVHTLIPLAAAAALKGDDAWAAQILGTRHAVTESTGAMIVDRSVNELREDTERAVSARLGPERWARAHAAGRKTSIDSLMNEIDTRRG